MYGMRGGTLSLPFFGRERESLLLDVVCGAAAGALGTFVLGKVMKATSKALPQKPREGEQQTVEEQEGPTEKVARKVLEPLGIKVEGERKQRLGQAVHWGYGITWGAIYGGLHRRLPWVGRLFGIGFGTWLFLFGDELLLPALKLSPSPWRIPLPVHVSALAAHLAYGSAAEGSYRLMRQALA